MLGASSLGKRFGSRWIFRGLDFSLEKGDVLLVTGNNGSGKSTLLKVLMGLLSPTEGNVHRPEGEIRRTMGYAALDLAVYPSLSAKEHLDLAAKLRGCPTDPSARLTQVGLELAIHQPVGQFSSGMRARLKFALAVQASPAVLILDEPSASLDRIGEATLASLIEDQRKRGVTILATNDPQDRRFATHKLEIQPLG